MDEPPQWLLPTAKRSSRAKAGSIPSPVHYYPIIIIIIIVVVVVVLLLLLIIIIHPSIQPSIHPSIHPSNPSIPKTTSTDFNSNNLSGDYIHRCKKTLTPRIKTLKNAFFMKKR